jgi:hypothetical protein
MAVGAQRGAAECARRWGQGGEEHRGRERGIPDRRLRIESGITLRTKDKPRHEQATATEPAQPRNTTDTPLRQAMSEGEKYEGAQGGHNARMSFENPPTLPETGGGGGGGVK